MSRKCLFTSGELGSSSYTRGDPDFSAGLSGVERVEHESQRGGVFLRKLRWEDPLKPV